MCRRGGHPLLWSSASMSVSPAPKYGCGVAQCGACSVHINGELQRSCSIPLAASKPATDRHIEGLSPNASHPIQKPGRARRAAMRLLPVRDSMMAAAALLKKNQATDQDIDQAMTNMLAAALSAHSRRVHLAARSTQWQPRGGSRRQQVLREAAMDHQDPRQYVGRFHKSGKSKPKVSRRGFVVGSAARPAGLRSLPFAVRHGAADAQSAGRHRGQCLVWCSPTTPASSASPAPRWGRAPSRAWSSCREELDCDWKKVKSERGHARQNLARKRVWGEMGTRRRGKDSAPRRIMCRGGAAARMMLMQAAADQWKVPVGELMAANGVITHAASKRTATYGSVAAAAAS